MSAYSFTALLPAVFAVVSVFAATTWGAPDPRSERTSCPNRRGGEWIDELGAGGTELTVVALESSGKRLDQIGREAFLARSDAERRAITLVRAIGVRHDWKKEATVHQGELDGFAKLTKTTADDRRIADGMSGRSGSGSKDPADGRAPRRGAPPVASMETLSETSTAAEQLHALLPYMSMDNVLHLERLDVGTAAQMLATVARLSSFKFGADPVLARVGPRMVKFLVAANTQVIPTWRAQLTPQGVVSDPEQAAVAIFAEMISRQAENNFLTTWQRSYDSISRESYRELLPLIRSLAGPEVASEFPARPIVTGAGLSTKLAVSNESGQRLTNVTLCIQLKGIVGEPAWHYYYVPAWESGASQPVVLALDWRSIGAARTIACVMEIDADQLRAGPRTLEIAGSTANAIDTTIDAVNAQWRRDPESALAQLSIARKLAKDDPDRQTACDAAKKAIRAELGEKMKDARSRLKAAQNTLDRLFERTPQDQPNNPAFVRAKQNVKAIEEEVRKLQSALNH